MMDAIFSALSSIFQAIYDAVAWVGNIFTSIGNAILEGLSFGLQWAWDSMVDFIEYLWNDILIPLWLEYSELVAGWITEIINSDIPFIPSSVALLDVMIDIPLFLAALVASMQILLTIAVSKFVIKLVPTVG